MLTVGQTAPAFTRQPVFGLPAQVPCGRPIAVLFVRSLSSPWTRESLAQVQAEFPRFDLAGARVVAITDSGLDVGRDFVPRYHVLFPVVCDPDQALFQEWGVGGDGAVLGTVRALAMGNVRAAARALRHGHGPLERRQLKLPASFVVGPDGALTFAQYARSVTEPPPLQAMLDACSA